MKHKSLFFLLPALIVISMVVNSCKKDNAGSIQTLFTGGTWQLASVQVFYFLGSSQINIDTLNASCQLTQQFTFTSNNTCTYTNFACITQTVAGSWSLTSDQLFLRSDILCKDTVAGGGPGTSHPFSNAQIVNLGQYSMVLQTGDIATLITPTTKRRIVQYGFVRQKTASQ